MALVVNEVLTAAYHALCAASAADLMYWTEAELLGHMDESFKAVARRAGCFVNVNETAMADGVATIPLPARWVGPIQTLANYQVLSPSSEYLMRALSETYLTDSDDQPERCAFSDDGCRLHPVPNAAVTGSVIQIYMEYPEASAAGQTKSMTDFWTVLGFFAMIAEARGQRSKMAAPDIGKFTANTLEIFHSVVRDYWGNRTKRWHTGNTKRES